MDQQPIILFDATCFFCRNIAAWLAERSAGRWSIVSWQSHSQDRSLPESPDKLHIWFGNDNYLKGIEAWQYLIDHEPHLQQWNWLATKLGWTSLPAKILSRGGHFVRRICRSCTK